MEHRPLFPRANLGITGGLIVIFAGLLLPNYVVDTAVTPLTLMLAAALGQIDCLSLCVGLTEWPTLVLCVFLGIMAMTACLIEVTVEGKSKPMIHRLVAVITTACMYVVVWYRSSAYLNWLIQYDATWLSHAGLWRAAVWSILPLGGVVGLVVLRMPPMKCYLAASLASTMGA